MILTGDDVAQANASIELPASAGTVWQLIGGFGSLPDWLSYIPASELGEGGRVRRLANPVGETIVERLVAFDEAARSYTYAILEAPFPVVNYRATLRVRENGSNASTVEWSGTFTPRDATDDETIRLFRGIYEDGLAELAKRFAAD